MPSVFLIVVVVWVFSVCLHEFGHAWVAYRGGDHTVAEKGYLSMNPIHYTHPVTSFLLPILYMVIGGIGLPGGAVYIEKHRLRSRGWATAVSLAGPAMNLAIALVLVAVMRLVLIPRFPDHSITAAVGFLLLLQISAILFNLLPIPPLDGFQALAPWLPGEWEEAILPMAGNLQFLLFILLWRAEPVAHAFWMVVRGIMVFAGVDPGYAGDGFRLFQFWNQN